MYSTAKTELAKCSVYKSIKHDWYMYDALPPSSGPDDANEKFIIPDRRFRLINFKS